MSSENNEHIYPYRIQRQFNNRNGPSNPNNPNNQNDGVLIVRQLQNEVNKLKNEVQLLQKNINCFDDEKLYCRIINYVNHNCIQCQNNNCDGINRDRILTGNGAPSNNIGDDGSFYLDNDTGNYYIKIAGRWILRGNLRGPQGSPGSRILTGRGRPSDATGNIGDFYLDNISKRYYIKVGTSDADAVWVQQGSLDANIPIPIVLPINFATSVNVPSTSLSVPNANTSGALVANGNNTSAPLTDGIFILPTDTYYNFIYYAQSDVQITSMIVSFSNSLPIDTNQTIIASPYLNIPTNTPENDYTPSNFGVFFVYSAGTPAFTTQIRTIPIGLTLKAGSSFVIALLGYFGIDGTVPGIVNVTIV